MLVNSQTDLMGGRERMRDAAENPRDPRCALQLRRICGTCAHFQGALRPDEGAPEVAGCAAFQNQRHRLAKAWDCHRWTRKGRP